MKDRLLFAIKGVAIVGVAFHHIANRRFDPQANDWLKVLSFSFDWCVLAFFCVSGYLHALSDQKGKKSMVDFITKRAYRLLVPFVLLVIFYSLIWQLLEVLHVPGIGLKIPPDFIGKILASLWPVKEPVAEQLYFLPMLFAVSVLFVLVQRALGLYGIAAVTLATFLAGLILFPMAFTGFYLGVFIWALCFYASGYLLYHFHARRKQAGLVVLASAVVLIIFNGVPGLIHFIPFALLCFGTLLALDRIPLLVSTGEASGTIYIYHTPFLIQPLVIVASHLHGAPLQFVGGITAALLSVGLCFALFHCLKNTRAKAILM